MARTSRVVAATAGDARARQQAAEAYLEVAELVLDDKSSAMPSVAAGLAVLAGIASSDAICGIRLGQIHRGDDHRGASAQLKAAVPDGDKLARLFVRLIDLKDEAHYGLFLVPPARARLAVRWATQLVSRGKIETER